MTTDPLDRARLAELDAGLPDETRAAQLRAQAEADPRSAAVLDALAATRADLAAHTVPPIPPEVAQRWAAALAAAAAAAPAADAPAADAPATRRIAAGRRRAPRPALIAAAVLVIATVVFGVLQNRPAADGPRITHADLVATARAAVGVGDAGELADPVRRAACLRTVAPDGPAPDAPLLGARTVVYEGRPGVLLLLPMGDLEHLRIVVVDHGCHTLLAGETIER